MNESNVNHTKQGERQMLLRHNCFLLISGLGLSSAASAVTLTEDSKLDKAQAGYYRLRVGSVDVTALSDGTLGFEVIEQLTNVKPGEAEKLLDKAYVKSPVDASLNAFLIHLGDRLILVDAGTGELLGPKLFKLPGSLKNAGYSPEQITDILVTHVHPDHTGGLTVGGKKVFPNAIVHMDKRELAYWTDKAAAEKAPEPTKSFFKMVEPTVGPYIASGSVKTFDGETQLFPGLHAIPGYGHTPGQSYYVLESEGQKLIFWGDIIHVPDIQFANPNVTIKFDVDSTAAAARRKKDFADAGKHRTLVAMPHMYFPGVGHVAKDGDHFRWIPLPYVNDAKPVVKETKKAP
jgi:glyoxylase-like metal-dependent hydrolase (beta-lactamase superfamily II)